MQSGPPPVKTALDPREPTTAQYIEGKTGLSYKYQQRYTPRGPFQSAIPLNLDPARAQPDGFFADLYGLTSFSSRTTDGPVTERGVSSWMHHKKSSGTSADTAPRSRTPTRPRMGGCAGGHGADPPPLHGAGSCQVQRQPRPRALRSDHAPGKERRPDHVHIGVHGALGQRRERTSHGACNSGASATTKVDSHCKTPTP